MQVKTFKDVVQIGYGPASQAVALMLGAKDTGWSWYSDFLKAHAAVGVITRPGFYVFGGVGEPAHCPSRAARIVKVDDAHRLCPPPGGSPNSSAARAETPHLRAAHQP